MPRIRSFQLLIAIAALAVASIGLPATALADDDAGAGIVDTAAELLTALGHGDADKMAELVGDLQQRDRQMIEAISTYRFQITRAWIAGDTASVEYEWVTCFNHEAFAAATLPAMRATWKAGGADVGEAEKVYMGQLARIRGLIEQTKQVMVLKRYGTDAWRPTSQWFAAQPPANVRPVPLVHERVILTMAEEECGGPDPEAAAKRIIGAWKLHDLVDVVWTAQPGQPRAHYAESDKTMLRAMAIQEFRLGRVWVRGNVAWVEYHWTTKFLHEPYRQYLLEQAQAANPPANEAEKRLMMAQIAETVRMLKERVEAGTHFIRLRRHGDRWYNFGDPLGLAEPQGEPTRTPETDDSE